ncbi:protein MCM10 homolog [Trichogramma pretiosum]|uniref:protein MCM10 homolog n=1 Tax=Trichogramma pretiosum TaxID=7493 RepID=UPI0006C991A3|nr:protein MCM10 homolog [Trichogramma pretiosum]
MSTDNDSDNDLLEDLLGIADDDDKSTEPEKVTTSDQKSIAKSAEPVEKLKKESSFSALPSAAAPSQSDSVKSSQVSQLKELDYNFLDVCDEDFADDFDVEKSAEKKTTSNKSKTKDSVFNDNGNSSDEEDKKYFENQQYSDYGREIKNLMKDKETEKSFSLSFKSNDNYKIDINERIVLKVSDDYKSVLKKKTNEDKVTPEPPKPSKYALQAQQKIKAQNDVYSDPIFGFRMITPLISSTDLVEKMKGIKPVTVASIKQHIINQKAGMLEDWVFAGVVLNKSSPKTSAKGSQYSIWKLTDLSNEMKTVAVFLFSNAYKQLWKLSTGTVIGILNPNVLESRDDKDVATLSVDVPQRVLVLGTSKDLGTCKSIKKNGDPCTAPTNIRYGEHCVYHVKQEYGKFSRRSELQTKAPQKSFNEPRQQKLNASTSSFSSFSQQRNPQAAPFIAVKAVRNEAMYKKDCERLAALRGDKVATEKLKMDYKAKNEPELKVKVTSVDLTPKQMKKDSERLDRLRKLHANDPSPIQECKKETPKFNLPPPKLGAAARNGIIDFSSPIPKSAISRAKLNAIEWVKKNGGLKKENPNKIKPQKEEMIAKGLKRKREEEENTEEKIAEKINKEVEAKSKFREMLEMKSSHSDLIENREDEEKEKYFRKLEVKEQMEEKMLSTYKMDCKAVYCRVCKYTAFSSSDMCKQLQHPIKVIDAVKRFFKCGDCGNRTISLDRIPTETCKRCSSSRWTRTSMMDEKRLEVKTAKLCIRGGEEKFIGSVATDASLNLLVPDE